MESEEEVSFVKQEVFQIEIRERKLLDDEPENSVTIYLLNICQFQIRQTNVDEHGEI